MQTLADGKNATATHKLAASLSTAAPHRPSDNALDIFRRVEEIVRLRSDVAEKAQARHSANRVFKFADAN